MNEHRLKLARLEIKFAAHQIHYHTLAHWIRLHRAAFVRPYPARWINNVYFDTFNYSAFAENLSGVSSRTKIRYRWYGKTDGLASGTLEVKCKRNCFGWKLRYEVPEVPSSAESWRTIRQTVIEQLPPAGRMWLSNNPFPVMANRYHREYFLSRGGKVRITIDTNQTVWDQRFKPYPNFARAANLPKSLVVEVKFNRQDRDVASRTLQGLPIRVSRHSKYVDAVKAVTQI
jgi:hypothetical protein